MAVNIDATRARAAGQIKTIAIDNTTAGATGYDVIADPGDGLRVVIMGYVLSCNVGTLVLAIESANGDDMATIMFGTGANSVDAWADHGLCSANASEKVTFTHSTAARCSGLLFYILEPA